MTITYRTSARGVLAVSLAALSLTVLGCTGFMTKQTVDAVVDGQIRLMEAQAKIDREKRQERYTIEGLVRAVEMREKEIPDPDPTHLRKKEEPTEKGVRVAVEQPKIKVKHCVVIFEDGREKEFRSVPPVPLGAGVYYRVEYNGMQEVVSVTQLPR